MFDLGWSEMGVIAVVALIVLGPKELPNALRTVTQLMKSARRLAGEFQSGVNEIVREAELEEARQLAQGDSKGSIAKAIEQVVDPGGDVKKAVNASETAAKQMPAATTNPAPALSSLQAKEEAPTPDITAAIEKPASEPAKAEQGEATLP